MFDGVLDVEKKTFPTSWIKNRDVERPFAIRDGRWSVLAIFRSLGLREFDVTQVVEDPFHWRCWTKKMEPQKHSKNIIFLQDQALINWGSP